MSTPRDMAECELRNDEGYPCCQGPITRPRATIDTRGAPLNSPMVDQRVDNSRNKNSAVPWAVLGASFGFLGFGGMIAVALLKPWESEGRAVRAEIRAEFAQQIAEISAEAKQAGNDAAIWKNRVVKLEARLDERR